MRIARKMLDAVLVENTNMQFHYGIEEKGNKHQNMLIKSRYGLSFAMSIIIPLYAKKLLEKLAYKMSSC